MVMIKDSRGQPRFSVGGKLYDFLMRCQEKILKEDSQVFGILWGDVGSGKSVRALQMCKVVDPSFDYTIDKKTIKRVAFNQEEYINAIIDNRKKSIQGDEGISLFFSRNVMTKEGRLISELMDQIRQKNLFVLICVPKLLSIDSSILESANFIGYVWESVNKIHKKQVKVKGNIAIYPNLPGYNFRDNMINYLKAKKRNPNYNKPVPNNFLMDKGNPIGDEYKKPWYPCGKKLYLKKKESILTKYKKGELNEDNKSQSAKDKHRRNMALKVLKEKTGLSTYKIGELVGMPRGSVRDAIERAKLDENGGT